MDNVTTEKRSAIMSKVKAKDTGLEKKVRSLLWENGVRYNVHPKGNFGNPDLLIRKSRTVIFIDSCFWHGCPLHFRTPKTNEDYWREKISKNMARDQLVNEHYEMEDWRVVRIWEHDLKNQEKIVSIINEIKTYG